MKQCTFPILPVNIPESKNNYTTGIHHKIKWDPVVI